MFSVCIIRGFGKVFNQLAYGGAKNIPVMYIRGFGKKNFQSERILLETKELCLG